MQNHGKKPACALICALALVPAGPAAAQVLTARIAAQETLAPKWIQTAKRVTGICPDILAALERAEPRLRFTGYRNSRSLPALEAGLESGSLDAACALIETPRRAAIGLRIGKPVYVIRHVLAGRRGDDAVVRDVSDLVRLDALVTAQRSSALTPRLKRAGVRVDDATDDNAVNLRKMLAGHGRFVYINALALQHYVRVERLQQQVRVLPAVLAEEPAYFWVSRKADPALARLLAPALGKLRASGELDRIYARWAATP
jgi:glutamate/aspartate transport system substrate-binding protein